MRSRPLGQPRWLAAGEAILEDTFERAAELFDEIGHVPHAAYAHLRAAERLVSEGRRAEADIQLGQALSFYRRARATFFIRRAEPLLAASA